MVEWSSAAVQVSEINRLVRCIVIRTGFLSYPVCSIENEFWCFSPPGFIVARTLQHWKSVFSSGRLWHDNTCVPEKTTATSVAHSTQFFPKPHCSSPAFPIIKVSEETFAKKRCECDSKSCQHTLFLAHVFRSLLNRFSQLRQPCKIENSIEIAITNGRMYLAPITLPKSCSALPAIEAMDGLLFCMMLNFRNARVQVCPPPLTGLGVFLIDSDRSAHVNNAPQT